jgi:Skp family chaperone for outer membrane proteins
MMLVARLCLVSALTLLVACSSATIALKEKLGIPKRDQLVARVQDAKEAQQDAKKEFQSALDQFLALTGGSGTELESKHKKLNAKYEDAKDAASTVSRRIESVETVSEALFREWRAELAQYQNPSLRADSERLMNDTRRKYDQLHDVMKAAEAKMDPVLSAFRDQVLFLKHNLNAQAIASLQDDVTQIQGDVARLIKDMQASIDEATAFIDQMNKGS